ncbi:MFS transporter [Rossellomorea vietnamensis]|uniref:MFS transporter n=1 Tax=Rossellomorea vietnamensis TaxID=218284 RepID=A0A5D4MEC5_9BACI|nr:MFS transporter [Rossellomorea vietnamensis]TYS00002.1 MFS transporter [Rossellomorea vietnamensis]
MKNLLNRYPGLVWIRVFGELLTSVTGSMLAPFLIIYLYDKLDGAVLLPMIIVGLQPLTEIIITLLGGNLTDRLGRKKIIVAGLVLQAGAMAGFIFAESVWMFALLYVINGAGRSVYIPAQRAQIADSIDDGLRSEVFALLNTVGAAGLALGPVIGYFVYTQDPALMFGMQAAALTIYLIVVYFKLPETLPDESDEILQAASGFHLKSFISKNSYVFGLMAFSLPISFFYAQTETNYRIYLEDLFPDFLVVLTTLASIKAVMCIFLEIPLVKWSNKYSFKRIIIISYSLYFVAAISYGFSTSMLLLIFTQLIVTVAESLGLNRLLNHVSEIAPSNKRGLYFSIYGTHWDISRMAGPFLGGMILIEWGGAVLFVLSALLLLLGGFAQFLLTTDKFSLHSSIKLSMDSK